MPGENEKQPGQAPEQIPPGWRQYARESSEHPSSARVDGRRVECFAVIGKWSRGLGSGQAMIHVFREGAITLRTPSVLCPPISPSPLNPCTLKPTLRILTASNPGSSAFNV